MKQLTHSLARSRRIRRARAALTVHPDARPSLVVGAMALLLWLLSHH